jgi:hypothetical protein
MRTFVANRTAGFNVNVDVGGDDTAPDFDVLNVPTFGNSYGTPLDVSAYGRYFTFVCGGSTGGSVVEVQASEDGTEYAAIATFQNEVQRLFMAECVAKWLRVYVFRRSSIPPFSVSVAFGATPWDYGSVPTSPPPSPTTPKSYIPERWAVVDVPGTQAATAMATNVSMISDDFMVDRSGSVIGLVLRFDALLTAGAATAEVTVNGVGTGFTVAVSTGSREEYAVATIGDFPFVAGDLIGATLATAGVLPAAMTCELTVEMASS